MSQALDVWYWRNDAACRDHPTDWWFETRAQNRSRADAICMGCPVRSQCLEYALAHPTLTGLWATTTVVQRASMRAYARTERDRTGTASVTAGGEDGVRNLEGSHG